MVIVLPRMNPGIVETGAVMMTGTNTLPVMIVT
jgi:hypothetical protein